MALGADVSEYSWTGSNGLGLLIPPPTGRGGTSYGCPGTGYGAFSSSGTGWYAIIGFVFVSQLIVQEVRANTVTIIIIYAYIHYYLILIW